MRQTPNTVQAPRRSIGMLLLRYGIGAVMVLAGIVMLIVDPSGLGVDGFAMAVGGGLSVLLINFLYRLGVSGDTERDAEERARTYFDEHGEWPEEEERVRGRRWALAPGVQTADDEARERDRRG
ncbi:MAG: hypothetical protein JO262_20490 [Solirubrobacterales bacterium]|nr:hypothetical protein [Solirubrobacterales bacterium]